MSAEAEAAVIGAALLSPGSLALVADHITADDFQDVALGRGYALLQQMRAAGDKIDPITFVDRAAAEGIRGLPHERVHQIFASTPTAANADYYAQIVADAATKRRLVVAGQRLAQIGSSEIDATQAMTAAREVMAGVSTKPTGGLQAPTLGHLLEGSDEYDWLIPGLLERRDRLVLTGGEGAGKSTWVRQIVLASAAGVHPVTFEQIEPVRCLVVDAENSEKQWRRKAGYIARHAARRGSVDPADTVHIACVARLDITTDRDLSAVHRLVDEHDPQMLAIGPLYKLVPRAITSDDDAAPLIDALDSLRARGLALVMEAHAGHAQTGDGERNLRPRGSAALLGWPEFGMGLRAVSGDPAAVDLVRWRGDRDERSWPARLRRGTTSGWPWVSDDTTSGTWTPSGAHEKWS
ncbi:replicative DNA helicase [Salana multivorans]|uniref:Replicative DNA helicase n=1 Tax=Salana multivorans TaxID=120377 RepID=A0A3N2DDK9_9MICO|nr:AAA family ATPase [Salana multivorans]ROR97807.1 replicative DNA helicase [Salana multivorans]